MTDARAPLTAEAIEAWLRDQAARTESRLADYPDGEIVDMDSRSVTVFDPEATRASAARYRAAADLVREHRELAEIAMEMRNALTTLRDNGIFYEDFPLKYSREVMVKHLEYLQRVHARYVELESMDND